MTKMSSTSNQLSPMMAKMAISRIWFDRGSQSQRRNRAMSEISKRQGKSATYTEPLLVASGDVQQQNDIQSFLATFYKSTIFEQSQHFHDLLRNHPDTIGTHYELLVPDTVSYDQFWSRYMYRCSLTTVLQEVQAQEEFQTKITQSIMPMLQTKLEARKNNKVAASFLPKLHSKLIQEEIEKATTTADEDTTTTLEGKTAKRAALFLTEAKEDITEQQDITETEESESSESSSSDGDDGHEEDVDGATATAISTLEAEVMMVQLCSSAQAEEGGSNSAAEKEETNSTTTNEEEADESTMEDVNLTRDEEEMVACLAASTG